MHAFSIAKSWAMSISNRHPGQERGDFVAIESRDH